MAYSEELANDVREALTTATEPGDLISEQKMFGGLAFLVNGKMFAGVMSDHLMLKLGAEGVRAALQREHVRPMDFTGRVMKAMVYVDPPALAGGQLADWILQAMDFVRTEPRKPSKPRPRRPSAR